MSLDEFLAQPRTFVWGVSDCALVAADWLIANGYDDPASALRGAYSTEQECRALLDQNGGLLPLVASLAAVAGLEQIDRPEVGCVAVIGARRNRGPQWAAIRTSEGWAVLSGDNLIRNVTAKGIRMWRVECRPS